MRDGTMKTILVGYRADGLDWEADAQRRAIEVRDEVEARPVLFVPGEPSR